MEIPRGRGVLKTTIFEAKYEAKLEFPGGRGGATQKTFRGWSINIFRNCKSNQRETLTVIYTT